MSVNVEDRHGILICELQDLPKGAAADFGPRSWVVDVVPVRHAMPPVAKQNDRPGSVRPHSTGQKSDSLRSESVRAGQIAVDLPK
jgi:hypothetical protein